VVVAGNQWDEAPDGMVLDVGGCGAVDGDGQGCARTLFHPLFRHQHTGLRRWLETTLDEAVIRIYDGSRRDELEAMESPVFEALGFSAVARREVERTRTAQSLVSYPARCRWSGSELSVTRGGSRPGARPPR
jgi:hypothetical protein